MRGAESFGKVCGPDLPREVLVQLLVRAAADILRLESYVGYLQEERDTFTQRLLQANIACRDRGVLLSGEARVPRASPLNGAYERNRDRVRAKRLP